MLHRIARYGVLGLLSLAAGSLPAQEPVLQYLHPSGGTPGSTVEVELVGKGTDLLDRFYFSRPGIEARALGKGRLAITIAADAPIGECDVWGTSTKGLAAPARFVVDPFPVRVENEPNNRSDEGEEVALPAVVGGRIDPPTDGDWFRVSLAKGDVLTIACRSTTLGGTLWPTLTVVDPQGREVAHDSLTRLEPVLHVTAAEAGVYSIGVEDRAYRVNAAPFYRLSLTTGPWLTGILPPSTSQTSSQPVTQFMAPVTKESARLGGRSPTLADLVQLADAESPRHAPAERGWVLSRSLFVESYEVRAAGAGGAARLERLDRPVRQAALRKTGDGPAQAERLELPADVTAGFSSPREVVHWYRFTAKQGTTLWLEAAAERINRPLDVELIVHDAAGKALETLGDTVIPKGDPTPVPLESRDPAGSWRVPADGEFLLAVRDLLASPADVTARSYRLSIGPRLEAVRVVAVMGETAAPRGPSATPGKKTELVLVAVRRGGHQEPIEIRAEGVSSGLTIQPLTIGAKESTGKLVLEASASASAWLGPVRLVAATKLNGKPYTCEVRGLVPLPGTTPPQARLTDEIVFLISGPGAAAKPQ